MRNRSLIAVLLALSGAGVSESRAQASNQTDRTVRAVVDSFFAAIERERWDSAAAFIDLPRFEPFFKQQVTNARSALPQRA
ncbi:MAG TPA: hypothetical protein VK636_05905, partial [Gemmatimonadaceae bacterium]|nr:hypothetical protein [Gemmatimonadaceae bacterium]